MQYTTNPIIIDALQWDGTYTGMLAIKQQYPQLTDNTLIGNQEEDTVSLWKINAEGTSYLMLEDYYVIKDGEKFLSMNPQEFAATYQSV